MLIDTLIEHVLPEGSKCVAKNGGEGTQFQDARRYIRAAASAKKFVLSPDLVRAAQTMKGDELAKCGSFIKLPYPTCWFEFNTLAEDDTDDGKPIKCGWLS